MGKVDKAPLATSPPFCAKKEEKEPSSIEIEFYSKDRHVISHIFKKQKMVKNTYATWNIERDLTAKSCILG